MILLAIRRLWRLLARLTGGSLAVLGNPPRRSLRSPHNSTACFARPTLSKLAPLAFTPTLVPTLLEVRSKTAASDGLGGWIQDCGLKESGTPLKSDLRSRPQTASEVGFEVAASNGLGGH